MTDKPQVTVLTDAQATEMRRLHRTRSIECGALTATLACDGCDGAAMYGGGRCVHDCHTEAALRDACTVADPPPAEVLAAARAAGAVLRIHDGQPVVWTDGRPAVVPTCTITPKGEVL